ncbi:unnamed protein product, partial [Citrullus colocynthis]
PKSSLFVLQTFSATNHPFFFTTADRPLLFSTADHAFFFSCSQLFVRLQRHRPAVLLQYCHLSTRFQPMKEKDGSFCSTRNMFLACSGHWIICGSTRALVWIVNIGHFHDPSHGGVLGGAIHDFK